MLDPTNTESVAKLSGPSHFLRVWFGFALAISAILAILCIVLLLRSEVFRNRFDSSIAICILAPMLCKIGYPSIKRHLVKNQNRLPFGSGALISSDFRFDLFYSFEMLLFLLLAAWEIYAATKGQGDPMLWLAHLVF